MFYSFANNPKVPGLDFSQANITDSTHFSQMMEANAKREKILGLILSASNNPNVAVDAEALKSAIEDLNCSVDLVDRIFFLTSRWRSASKRMCA